MGDLIPNKSTLFRKGDYSGWSYAAEIADGLTDVVKIKPTGQGTTNGTVILVCGVNTGKVQVTIDSEERALQVANAPEHAPQIMEIMKEMKALRTKVNPLISDHATVSIALKNKKAKEEEKVESTSDPVPAEDTELPEDLTENSENEFLED